MRITIPKKSLTVGIIAAFTTVVLLLLPSFVSAQSGGPDFQITSSKNISAIAGESFTYFVVTENDTPFQLTSQLPAGLTFSNNQISGTPQQTGDYTLEFTASNSSGSTVQTVNLSVIGGGTGQQSSAGSANQDNDGGSTGQTSGNGTEGQLAQSEGSVGLNEIPDTGLSADQALTISFYALALLMLTWVGVRKLTPRFATDNTTGDFYDYDTQQSEEISNHRNSDNSSQVGDGII